MREGPIKPSGHVYDLFGRGGYSCPPARKGPSGTLDVKFDISRNCLHFLKLGAEVPLRTTATCRHVMNVPELGGGPSVNPVRRFRVPLPVSPMVARRLV